MNKTSILRDTRELVFLTVYLTLFLSSLTIYRSILLELDIMSYFRFGYNFLEALILAKIIMLGQILKLGNKYSDRSLIIPTLYKSIVFSLFVFVLKTLEHFVLGLIKGNEFSALLEQFTKQKAIEGIGVLLISFLFFIIFFSFEELKRVIGEDKVFNLFFRRK